MFLPATARASFEPAARELVRLMRDDLPERLAEIESSSDPVLELEDLAEIDVSMHLRTVYPSLEIQWITTRFPEDSRGDECPEDVDAIHEFNLDLAITGDNEGELYYKFARYLQAMRKTLWASGGQWRVLDEQLLEAGRLQDSTSVYLRHGFVHVEVRP